jgi:hypothetical protein
MEDFKKKSERHVLADSLSEYVSNSKFIVPRNREVSLTEKDNKKFYSFSFVFRKLLSAKVDVYGTEFIHIDYIYANREGSKTFGNKEDFRKFFKLGFLDGDWTRANKVKTKDAPKGEEDTKNNV